MVSFRIKRNCWRLDCLVLRWSTFGKVNFIIIFVVLLCYRHMGKVSRKFTEIKECSTQLVDLLTLNYHLLFWYGDPYGSGVSLLSYMIIFTVNIVTIINFSFMSVNRIARNFIPVCHALYDRELELENIGLYHM